MLFLQLHFTPWFQDHDTMDCVFSLLCNFCSNFHRTENREGTQKIQLHDSHSWRWWPYILSPWWQVYISILTHFNFTSKNAVLGILKYFFNNIEGLNIPEAISTQASKKLVIFYIWSSSSPICVWQHGLIRPQKRII